MWALVRGLPLDAALVRSLDEDTPVPAEPEAPPVTNTDWRSIVPELGGRIHEG